MRKNDLIEMLNKLEGNPEIVLWNGFVGDYMHVDPKLVEGQLVKQTFTGYLESCRLKQCHSLKNWDFQFSEGEINELKKSYKRYIKWEDNAYVREEDVKSKRYQAKRIVYINAKKRGVKTWDRCGSLDY